MSTLLDRVRAESETLSLEEKQRFALELLAFCADTLEPAENPQLVATDWQSEISNRIGDVESGQAEFSTWENVKAVAEARVKWPKT